MGILSETTGTMFVYSRTTGELVGTVNTITHIGSQILASHPQDLIDSEELDDFLAEFQTGD